MIERNVSELRMISTSTWVLITGAGTYHIECNYNAYQGCSGEPVIAMDERYSEYRRKVIVIHAGCPESLLGMGINIVFKLRCKR
jgi:hypothetical protein